MMAGGEDWHLMDYRGTGIWPEAWPPVSWRFEAADLVRFRMMPGPTQLNRLGAVHGAFLAGLAENCMGLVVEQRPETTITVSLAYDYPISAEADVEIVGTLRIIRETGRMIFVAVELAQDDVVILHGSGVLRKVMPR